MTNFFQWRSCDLTGLGVAEAIKRNQDVLDRGNALLINDSGLPPDDTVGDVAPVLDISNAEWGDETDGGSLPAGTYNYKLVPIDTCTGRTGQAVSIPSQTISTLGKARTLRVTFNSKPGQCVGALVQRDGVIIGKIAPLTTQVLNNMPVVRSPPLTGSFINGTKVDFDLVPGGADLIVGDMINYQNRGVQVIDVTGTKVTVNPPVGPDKAPTAPSNFDMFQRTNAYFISTSGPGAPIFYGVPFPSPLFSFMCPIIPGLLCVPQLGDVIVYGSKTAIVVGVQPNITTPGMLDVGLLPFGLLPVPPLPAGLFWLIYRPITAPTFGTYTNGTNNQFRVGGNPPSDTSLQPGTAVAYGGEIKTIDHLTPSGANTDVVLSSATTNSPTTSGVYFVIPSELSPFLTAGSITPTGTYTRLSRVVSITTQNNLWQWKEDGAFQARTGDVGTTATEAKATLNQIFTQAGYAGGLPGLLEKIRGPATSHASKVFNSTLGLLTQPTGGDRLLAVNDLAKQGNGTTIDLNAIRSLRSLLCNSFNNVTTMATLLATETVVVERYGSQLVVTPAVDCPPGQTATSTVEETCLGPATTAPASKAQAHDVLRIFWAPAARFQTGAKRKLLLLGLTEAEAQAAVSLTTAGRVVAVQDLPNTVALDIADLGGLGTASQIDEIIDDGRINSINNGRLTRDQLNTLLHRRGRSGIAQRVPGTDNNNITLPGYRPIDDFNITAHQVTALVLQNPNTFDICDETQVLAAIKDPTIRNAVAGAFALFDAAINGLIAAGAALQRFLQDSHFLDALDAISGFISSLSADPTLGCLIGPLPPLGFGLPTIPGLDQLFQGFSFPFGARFSLSALFAQAIQTIICALLDGLLSLINSGTSSSVDPAFAQRLIGCLPNLLNLPQFPDINLQIVLECNLERLNILADLINELIAEANEIIDFANSLGSGLVYRSAGATNLSCSGNENITDVFGQAIRALGFG